MRRADGGLADRDRKAGAAFRHDGTNAMVKSGGCLTRLPLKTLATDQRIRRSVQCQIQIPGGDRPGHFSHSRGWIRDIGFDDDPYHADTTVNSTAPVTTPSKIVKE